MTFLETQTSDRRSKGDLVRPLRSYWWWQHLLSRVECKVLPVGQQCLHPEEEGKVETLDALLDKALLDSNLTVYHETWESQPKLEQRFGHWSD